MLKEDIIIRILGKSMEFLAQDQAVRLKVIIETELYSYDIQPNSTAIVPHQGIPEKLMLFLIAKKLEGLAYHSLTTYSRHLTKFSQSVHKKIEDIDTMDIRMYLAQCSQRGLKNSSILTEMNILRSFFTWLENEDHISKSPMRKIKSIKKEQRVRKSLSQEELENLRVACKSPREKAMVEFFYSTGCRLDEVCKVNKSDIDWSQSKLQVIGKGDKERTVFLNAKAKVHLKKYLASRKDNNEALFVGERDPHDRLGRRAFQIDFNKLGKLAGIIKSVHPHLLRHTTATIAVNNGASLQSVQKMLGHSNPSTTLIYADLNIEEVQMSHKRCVS